MHTVLVHSESVRGWVYGLGLIELSNFKDILICTEDFVLKQDKLAPQLSFQNLATIKNNSDRALILTSIYILAKYTAFKATIIASG